MKQFVFSALCAVLILSCSLPAHAQSETTPDDPVAQRKAKILDNLKLEFPQLQEYPVEMIQLEPSAIPGLDQGSFLINGTQLQKFLVTSDDTRLYLLAADAIDVSRTSDEIAAIIAEQKEAALRQARERNAELMEVVAGWPVRGNPDAPVTIVEFSDFQCPYCSRGYTTVEQILQKYPQEVKFVYLHFPLPNHPWAMPASIAAVCATHQDPEAFWTLHDSYFENQKQITPGNIIEKSKAFLAETGIDMATWSTCAEDTESEAYKEARTTVENSMAAGQRFGVTGTPGFFVNGRFVSGAQPLETFDALIEEARQDAQ
ncbi:MAG: DsbA family protein [Rhodothermales bacterium]